MNLKQQALPVAQEAVEKAAEHLRSIYEQSHEISTKNDNSIVTAADKTVEAMIVRTIRETFPDHNFHGEEAQYDQTDSEYTWVIDPIDGTRFFARNLPQFGILLALQKGQELVLAISCLPIFRETLYAIKGGGAYLNEEPVTISQTTDFSQAYCNTARYKWFLKKQLVSQLESVVRNTSFAGNLGHTWSLHLMVQQKLDMIIEPVVHYWDIATHALVIQEAGGQTTDLAGKPITSQTTSFLASNGHLHQQVLSIFKKK